MSENKMIAARETITKAILWLFIFSASIQMGGSIYEMFVINNLWAGSPPESVTGWNPVPEYAIEPAQFWRRIVPLHALSTIAILISAWLMPQPNKRWALVAGMCALLVILSTGLFFVPILRETIFTRGAGLSAEEITGKVNQWIMWNWPRMILVFVSWFASIYSLITRADKTDQKLQPSKK